MPDIFLSYNREDQAVARRFAEAFKAQGFDVWWDTTLHAGDAYDKVTEQALSEAKAVVVLWSPRSVDSRWVRAEATQADRNGTLIPVMIEPCKRPIMFELTQTAELNHWKGDPKDAAWIAFLSDVRRHLAKDAPSPPSPGPVPRKTAAGLSMRNPVVVGAVVVTLAVVAMAFFVVVRPPSGAASGGLASQRTAFFGFSVDGDNAAAVAMAKSATGETYDTLSALGLDTASASETQNVERGAQLARAKDLMARYALGGEVRRDGDQFRVSIRLDDVQARTTLWQDTLTGGDAEQVSLPIQAAARATNVVQCYIGTRVGLRTETDEILGAMKRACAASNAGFVEQAELKRELARLVPDSASIQANLALWLFLALAYVPDTSQLAMRTEIDDALKRAQGIDPANRLAQVIRADLTIADGGDLWEAEKLFIAARDANPNFFFLNIRYGLFLTAVGRYRAALNPLRTSVRQSPLTPGLRVSLAYALAFAGQPIEAEETFRHNVTRLPDGGATWSIWIQSALFDGAGDPREVLARAPSDMSGDTVACVKAIVDGVLSQGVKERAAADSVVACLSNRVISTRDAIRPMVKFGRLGDAFSFAKKGIDRKAYNLVNASVLFTPAMHSMRADPRFLPFVKELGIYQYWIDSKSRPDICDVPAEQVLPVCAELLVAQGR